MKQNSGWLTIVNYITPFVGVISMSKDLTTPRLLLTAVRAEDACPLAEFWREQSGRCAADSNKLLNIMLAQQTAGQGLFWLLRLRREPLLPVIVGICELNKINRRLSSADAGGALSPAWRGRGLMREALSAVTRYAFSVDVFTELWADIDERNQPSLNLFTNAGFARAVRAPNPFAKNNAVSLVLHKEEYVC